MTISCGSCRQTITLPNPLEIGRVLTCSRCQAEQEVVWLFPLELMPVKKVSFPDQGKMDREEHGLPGGGK